MLSASKEMIFDGLRFVASSSSASSCQARVLHTLPLIVSPSCVELVEDPTDGRTVFQRAGISTDASYSIGLGGTGVAFCGTVASWFLLARVGRRKLYGGGMAVLCLTMLIIGGISSGKLSDNAKWGAGGLCVFWLFIYSLTVGPVAYTIVSETSAVRLRTKTVCLARNSYCIMNIVYSTLENYFMNPTEWNLAGKTAYFWFATSFIITVWSYFRLPEAMGRTYEEM